MEEKTVATNRKAFYDYFIENRWEAGIVLTGTEIKSVREGRVNLRDSYVRVENNEAWLLNAHISPYTEGNRYNVEPLRRRKLLLHKTEVRRLQSETAGKGLTIVALRMYIKGSRAKVEIAIAKGKKEYDKRDAIARRDQEREMRQEVE